MVGREVMVDPYLIPTQYPKGRYLLAFDPLDGSSNIDVNVSVGSIFSVLGAPDPGAILTCATSCSPVRDRCAPATRSTDPRRCWLSAGTGVHAFTLDPAVGEFILTREQIRIAHRTTDFAINASNQRFWEPAVQRYVKDCLAGRAGPRRKDFNMRWVASLVAETHRILTRGGVFLYPRDSRDPAKPGRLCCRGPTRSWTWPIMPGSSFDRDKRMDGIGRPWGITGLAASRSAAG